MVLLGVLLHPCLNRGYRYQVTGIVDFLDDRKAGKLDQVHLAQRQFEKDFADGSAVADADVLAWRKDHDWGNVGPAANQSESPRGGTSLASRGSEAGYCGQKSEDLAA